MTAGAAPTIGERLRAALTSGDLDALGALLADDVRWGDDDAPNKCRGPDEVLATFASLRSSGVSAEVVSMTEGRAGVVCELAVRWPEQVRRPGDRHLFHVYLLRGGQVCEIRRYDDRDSAAEAAGAGR